MRRPSRPVRPGRLLAALVALAALAAALPTGSALAGSPPTVSVNAPIGTCGLYGDVDLGTADQLIVKHRRADGTLVARDTVTPQAGSWVLNCPGPVNKGDDRLEFFRGSETTPFRVFRLPRLVLRPDRIDEVVRGTATRSPDQLELIVTNCDPDGGDCFTIVQSNPVPAPGTGAFSVTIGDLRGGDNVYLTWTKGADSVWLPGFTGQLVVQPGSRNIVVRGPMPGQKVTVRLRRGSWTASTTVRLAASAQAIARVRHNGVFVKPKVGDVISATVAPDAKITVPPFYLFWNENGISGRCFKNAIYSVDVMGADGIPVYRDLDAAEEDGSWSDPRIVETDEYVHAWCANTRGDQLFMVGFKS